MNQPRNATARSIGIIVLLVVLTILVAVLSMNVGKMNLSPMEVFKVIIGEGTRKQNLIVFDFRLPRIVLGILVGIGMAISGCIMQSLLKNDMVPVLVRWESVPALACSYFCMLLYSPVRDCFRPSSCRDWPLQGAL